MTSTIYATTSVSPIITPKQLYNSHSIPYFKLEITQQVHAANTASFESSVYLPEASKISIVGSHLPFTGQVQKVSKNVDGYTYDCIDSTRVLFGKISTNKQKQYSGKIIKSVLKGTGLGTGNISKGKYRTKVAWKDTKRIDIINQLATLDGYEFFINPDGVPIYRKPGTQTKAHVFYSTGSVTDFDIQYDITDIITGVTVYGKDDKFYYKGQNSKMIHKYGNIQEILRDGDIKTLKKAKSVAAKEYSEKGTPKLDMTLELPVIMRINEGEWIVFKAPSWVNQPVKSYFVESVKTKIDDENMEQELSLLEAKPEPPSDWTYKSTSTSSSSGTSTSTTIAGITVSGLKTPRDVRKWVDSHIRYKYYFNGRYSNAQVLKQRWGNCVDQSELCVALCKGIGFKAKVVRGAKCGGVGHMNWKVYWAGRWRRGDTVCHKQSEF